MDSFKERLYDVLQALVAALEKLDSADKKKLLHLLRYRLEGPTQ